MNLSPFCGKRRKVWDSKQKEKAWITCASNIMKDRQMGEEKDALSA